MRLIKVEGSINKNELYKNFTRYIDYLDYHIEDRGNGKGFSLEIELESIQNDDIFYDYLSKAIEDIIINDYIDRIIEKRVERIYPGEYSQLDDEVYRRIKEELRLSDLNKEDKFKAREQLKDYLRENDSIYLDGYLRFRLTDYLYILDIAIDRVITEMEEEERMDEFIEQIKYFVEIQPAHTELIHVIIAGMDFKVLDKDLNPIGREIIDRIYEQYENHEDIPGSKADVLLSTLITMAPERLMVHFKGDRESLLIRAILRIFEDRVTICDGCSICEEDRT